MHPHRLDVTRRTALLTAGAVVLASFTNIAAPAFTDRPPSSTAHSARPGRVLLSAASITPHTTLIGVL